MQRPPQYTVEFAGVKGTKVDIVAATQGIWRWKFVCGSKEIASGGSVELFCEHPKFWLATVAQKTSPDLPGYVGLEGSAGFQGILQAVSRNWKSLMWARVILPLGMREGQSLTIVFGSEKHPCTSVAHKYSNAYMSWKVDYLGTRKPRRIWPPMVVNVVPGEAAKFYVTVPSILQAGDTLSIRGRVEDRNSNIGAAYSHPVTLKLLATDGNVVPGFEAQVPVALNGTFEHNEWRIAGPCVYRICASGPGLPNKLSNPVQAEPAPGMRVVWGDMHCHTFLADGVGTLKQNIDYARNQAFLDVFGFAEHLFTTPEYDAKPVDKHSSDWATLGPLVAETVREAYEPHRFVTILGYEYSPRDVPTPSGDLCVFSPEDKWEEMPMAFEATDLFALARQQGAIAIPHVGGRRMDLDLVRLNSEVSPVIEIASMHGHFECFAQKALQIGYKIGFVGMSDGHYSMPGYDNWAQNGRTPKLAHRNYSAQSAITGFLVSDLTREAVFAAMKNRHTYATTGQRILLDFQIADKIMGESVTIIGLPELNIKVWGTAPIAYLDIIRGDKRLLRVKGRGRMDIRLKWTDEQPLKGETWYYIRVTQKDCSLAWSSPIWVDYKGKQGVAANALELPYWHEGAYFPSDITDDSGRHHLHRLTGILKRRRIDKRFTNLEFGGIYEENRGRFALFYAKDRQQNMPVHICLYIDFADDRLYISEGVNDYGVSYN